VNKIDWQRPYWPIKMMEWVIFGTLLLVLLYALREVPRSALWTVGLAAVAITARIVLFGRRW
jgi:hypothetical protein